MTVDVTNLIGRPVDDNLIPRNYSNKDQNTQSLEDSRFATFEIGVQVNPTQIGLWIHLFSQKMLKMQ